VRWLQVRESNLKGSRHIVDDRRAGRCFARLIISAKSGLRTADRKRVLLPPKFAFREARIKSINAWPYNPERFFIMKPIRLLVLSLVSTLTAFSQTNTYPFPASGNVGIGTSSPQYRLDIFGPAGDHPARVATPHGFLIFGPANDSWSHFQTDRPYFYFNKGMWVDSGRVGSYDEDLQLQTAGTTRIFVSNASGDVGIGTTNPQKALDVVGDARFSGQISTGGGSSNYYGIGSISGSLLTANDRDIDRPNLGNNSVLRINHHTGISLSAHSHYGGIRFYNQGYHANTSNPIDGQYGATMVMALNNGNVGIGTANPGGKLQIMSTDMGDTKTYSPANGFGLILDQYYSGAPEQGASYTRTADIVASTGDISSSQIRFLTKPANANPSVALLIGSSGNIGIGTSNPTHKLAVNGTVKAQEVIVETTGWSDYVFADNYALQPLSEVEVHIKTNKHLPGIPSAAQIAEQGVSIGDMQARLLAKIEELTLHQIAQEKLLRVQAGQLAAQANELATLREEVRASRH
jgi:hypothetical protein